MIKSIVKIKAKENEEIKLPCVYENIYNNELYMLVEDDYSKIRKLDLKGGYMLYPIKYNNLEEFEKYNPNGTFYDFNIIVHAE